MSHRRAPRAGDDRRRRGAGRAGAPGGGRARHGARRGAAPPARARAAPRAAARAAPAAAGRLPALPQLYRSVRLSRRLFRFYHSQPF